MSTNFYGNPLSARPSVYAPPGFKSAPLTYDFSHVVLKRVSRNPVLHYLKTAGYYVFILALQALSYGFGLLGDDPKLDSQTGANAVGDSFEKIDDLDFPDVIPSSTPRGASPVLPENLASQSNPPRIDSKPQDADIFQSIFELDTSDDDLAMRSQYGISLSTSVGSKYVPRSNMNTPRPAQEDISAIDLLKTEFTPRDDYDDMISKFYKPFKPAPNAQYSLTSAILGSSPINDFSRIFKEKRGAIQQLVSQERAAAQSSVVPLSSDQLQSVNKYWGMRSASTPVVSAFSIDITVRDLQTLRDSNWLNDNVIDFYLNLIAESVQGTYCWTTHFFTTLKSKGYQGVARWAKRRKVNLAEKDKVVVPINIMGTHWAIAVVDNVAKTIGYYDSLSSGGNMKTVEILRDYMAKERERLQAPQMDYTLLPCVKTPQQQNGYDCGVFTCTVARFVAGDHDLTFSQKDMKIIRRKMAYEIMYKSLVDSSSSQPHL